MNIIGRKKEMALLKEALDSPGAELIAVYGRRRIGKTFLIKEFFNNKFDFYATGVYQGKQKDQIKAFTASFSKQPPQEIKDWMDAFVYLRDYLNGIRKKQLVVFLDELPWFDVPPGHFLKAFEWFWNSWGSTRPGLKMIVCGSATTWMVDRFIHDKGGLYNRTTLSIYLPPFDLHDSAELLRSKGIEWADLSVLDCYMVFGGVPYYLNMLRRNESLDTNIDRLFFSREAPLREEYEFLFRSLFRDSNTYMQIIDAMASRNSGVTREELIKTAGLADGGGLTTILKNLERSDFIRVYQPFGKKTKNALYQLIDPFILYYKRFVETYRRYDEAHWSHLIDHPSRRAWSGLAFEMVALLHLRQIKETLGIGGVQADVSSWLYKGDEKNAGAQIDMVIARRDRVINLCEMKYSEEEYDVTKSYETTLRTRRAIFREVTKTKKSIHMSLVTPFGLKNNAHAAIFNQVITLKDLLRE